MEFFRNKTPEEKLRAAMDTARDSYGGKATRAVVRILDVLDSGAIPDLALTFNALSVAFSNWYAMNKQDIKTRCEKIAARLFDPLDSLPVAGSSAKVLAAAFGASREAARHDAGQEFTKRLITRTALKLLKVLDITTPANATDMLDYVGGVACGMEKNSALEHMAVAIWVRTLDVIAAADKDIARSAATAAISQAPADSALAKQVAASLLKLSGFAPDEKSGNLAPDAPRFPDKKLPGPNLN